MVFTCYKNYGTPPNSTGAPVTRTRHALASEIDLLAGHAFVLARLIRRGSKTSSGNWRCRMSWSVECTTWGELFWLIRDPKKVRPKIWILSRRSIEPQLSIIQRSLERQN
jgi:hypothetical protein